LAAFYVVLFHGLPWLRQKFTLPRALETFLGNGYLAVNLFFILSGFILAYTYEGQIDGKTNRLHFWEARFARIYPVYFLSLILAFWFERGLSLGTRIAVLGMVQAWNPVAPQLTGAWNYPAWTLSVEAFFYLCFPFILPWMSRRSIRTLFWMMACLVMICIVAHTPVLGLGDLDRSSIVINFVPLPLLRIPEFLLGMVIGLRLLRAEAAGRNAGSALRTNLAVLSALLILSLPLGAWVSLVTVPFALLVYELAVGETVLVRVLSTRLMVLLGSASYAVYLLQFPVRSWTRVIFSRFPEKLAHLGAPLTPLILVLFSILVFKFWEEPCRRAMRSRFAAGKLPSAEVGYADLRLAVVSPFVDRRHGTERALAELLERLARDYGCEIHLYAQRVEDLSLSDPQPAHSSQAATSGGIFWHKVPYVRGPQVLKFFVWVLLNGLLRWWHTRIGGASYDLVLSPGINCLHPDVVIVHALFRRLKELAREENAESGAAAGFFRRAHRRVYYGLLALLERRIYTERKVTLAAVSKRTSSLLKEYFQREDVCVIPNGVDTGHFSVAARLARRAESRQRRRFSDEDFVLLLIGNDWRNKGLPTVLEAMAALPGLPIRLLVAGDDSPVSFRARAVQLGVQDYCRWEHSSPDVLDFYSAADVYVSPSREDSFGLPVAEAMACGLPVITSVSAGVSDYIRDGVDGYVLREPRDARALSQVIERLHTEPDLRRKVGDAAAKAVVEWDWDRNAAGLWELLKAPKSKSDPHD